MGLSSSQARLLNLTARMHQIEYGAARIEAMKLQMANESRRVYEDYLDALDKTKLQLRTLTTNGAVTFRDITSYEDFLAAGFALVVHGLPADFEFSEGVRLNSAGPGRLNSPRPSSTTGSNGADIGTYSPSPAAIYPTVIASVNNVAINSGDINRTVINPSTQQAIYGDSLTPVPDNAAINADDGTAGATAVSGGSADSGNTSSGVVNTSPKTVSGSATYSANAINPGATYATQGDMSVGGSTGKTSGASGDSSADGTKGSTGDKGVSNSASSVSGKVSNIVSGGVTNSGATANSISAGTGSAQSSAVSGNDGAASGTTPDSRSNNTPSVSGRATNVVSGSATNSALFNTNYATTGSTTGTTSGTTGGDTTPTTTPDDETSTGSSTGTTPRVANGTIYNGVTRGNVINLVGGASALNPRGLTGGVNAGFDPTVVIDPSNPSGSTINPTGGNVPVRGGSDPDPDPDPVPRGVSSGSSVICRTVGQLVEAIKALFTGPDGSPLDISTALTSNFETLLTNLINSGHVTIIEKPQGADDFPEIGTLEYADHETSVAINTSLQEVADDIEIRKAEAKYEADMKRIDMKDRRYDSELAALDNERNAIKQEIETMKTVAKDNVERTFKLFG